MLKKSQLLKEGRRQGLMDAMKVIESHLLNEDVQGGNEELNEEFVEAVWAADEEDIKNLLARGASVDARNKYGDTALMVAIDD